MKHTIRCRQYRHCRSSVSIVTRLVVFVATVAIITRCYNRRHRNCSTRCRRRRRRFRRSPTVAVVDATCTAAIVMSGTATVAIAIGFIFAAADCCVDSHVVVVSPHPQVRVSAAGHASGGSAWPLCIHCCMHQYSYTHVLTKHDAIRTRRHCSDDDLDQAATGCRASIVVHLYVCMFTS